MIWTARIDGAVSMADMRIEGDNIIFSNKVDKGYKYAALTNEICEDPETLVLMVSKDGKNFSLAVIVEIDKKQYTAERLGDMLTGKGKKPKKGVI